MYRQHPYAGYGPGPRRGGSPPGPGPDRSRHADGGHRRGRGRNRGASANFTAPREQPGYPPQRDTQYSEDPYFSNPPRNDLIQSAYSENGYGRDQDAFSGNGTPRQSSAKEETPVHDSLIEERLQRERPCRTLFIRNIKYETDSREFRRKFEEFGEIKTFFDLISHRGMVFCTYFDMRAAERAKERLQGTDLAGRPIDVHYSLPREDQAEDRNQGILIVTLIDSPTHTPIDDTELKRKCATFGDVKSISSHGRPGQRTVEFYDTRSCEEAASKLRHQSLGDGIMETEYGDAGGQPLPPGPAMKKAQEERASHSTGPRGRRSRGRGGRGGGGGGGDSGRWEEERPVPRREWGADRSSGRDEFGRDILSDRPASPPPVRGRFDRPEHERSPERSRGFASEPPLDPAEKARRDQAKKVQELLDALKQSSSAPSSTAPMPVAPAPYYPPPSVSQLPNPYAASILPPGLAGLVPLVPQPQIPPTQQSTYGAYEQLLMSAPHLLARYVPPQSIAPSTGGGYNPAAGRSANETNGMPLNLMALLERQNQHNVPPLPPPVTLRSPPTSIPQNQPSIQDIMALLQKTSSQT